MRPFKPHQNVSKHRLVPFFFLENSFTNQLMTPIVEGSSFAVLATAWCFWDSASYHEDGMIIPVESVVFLHLTKVDLTTLFNGSVVNT